MRLIADILYFLCVEVCRIKAEEGSSEYDCTNIRILKTIISQGNNELYKKFIAFKNLSKYYKELRKFDEMPTTIKREVQYFNLKIDKETKEYKLPSLLNSKFNIIPSNENNFYDYIYTLKDKAYTYKIVFWNELDVEKDQSAEYLKNLDFKLDPKSSFFKELLKDTQRNRIFVVIKSIKFMIGLRLPYRTVKQPMFRVEI